MTVSENYKLSSDRGATPRKTTVAVADDRAYFTSKGRGNAPRSEVMVFRSLQRTLGLVPLVGVVLLTAGKFTRAEEKPDFSRWEKTIAAFEEQDKEKPPPKKAILFVGSSSIRMWDLKKSFPTLDVINRGFGGSQIADSVHFASRLILKHEPRLVVFYAGDNDIAAGKKPEQVLEDFQALVAAIHKELPKTHVIFLSIKPSRARWKLVEIQQKANGLVADFCKKDERLLYVDVGKALLGEDGKPREELFAKDGLHLNDKGYELWTGVLKPHLK
jgi:lysophospholipase L1-like esterase